MTLLLRNDPEILDAAHHLPFISRSDQLTLDRITAGYTRTGTLGDADRRWLRQLIAANGSVMGVRYAS